MDAPPRAAGGLAGGWWPRPWGGKPPPHPQIEAGHHALVGGSPWVQVMAAGGSPWGPDKNQQTPTGAQAQKWGVTLIFVGISVGIFWQKYHLPIAELDVLRGT